MKGGLITTRHNKFHDWNSDFAGKTCTPYHVRYNTLIHPGHVVREGKAHLSENPHNNSPVATENIEKKGDMIIRKLWKRGTDSIHDMGVVNTDNPSHGNKSLEKCLQKTETEKK